MCRPAYRKFHVMRVCLMRRSDRQSAVRSTKPASSSKYVVILLYSFKPYTQRVTGLSTYILSSGKQITVKISSSCCLYVSVCPSIATLKPGNPLYDIWYERYPSLRFTVKSTMVRLRREELVLQKCHWWCRCDLTQVYQNTSSNI